LGGVVTHTYIHTYTRNLANEALSIRVTLNTKPASQVLKTRITLSNGAVSSDLERPLTGPKYP